MDVSLNEPKRNAYNFIRGGKLLENVIELQNVSKSFKGFQINNFSMEVKKDLLRVLLEEMDQVNLQQLK